MDLWSTILVPRNKAKNLLHACAGNYIFSAICYSPCCLVGTSMVVRNWSVEWGRVVRVQKPQPFNLPLIDFKSLTSSLSSSEISVPLSSVLLSTSNENWYELLAYLSILQSILAPWPPLGVCQWGSSLVQWGLFTVSKHNNCKYFERSLLTCYDLIMQLTVEPYVLDSGNHYQIRSTRSFEKFPPVTSEYYKAGPTRSNLFDQICLVKLRFVWSNSSNLFDGASKLMDQICLMGQSQRQICLIKSVWSNKFDHKFDRVGPA